MTKIVKGMLFSDLLNDIKQKQDELQRELAAMTPDERAAWDAKQAKAKDEAEEILKELRGDPGFFELKL